MKLKDSEKEHRPTLGSHFAFGRSYASKTPKWFESSCGWIKHFENSAGKFLEKYRTDC